MIHHIPRILLFATCFLVSNCDPGGDAVNSSNGHPAQGGTRSTGGSSGQMVGGGGASTVTASGGEGFAAPCGEHSGLWVDGRFLRDRCCEKVVLRGVNEMITWSPLKDGTPFLTEIAQTGANAVRIVWTTTDSPVKLEAVLKNTVDAAMIPLPELHDATGDMSKLASCVDYWVRPDVVAVLEKFQDKLIVNIANEVGDANVSRADWIAAYTSAVSRIRAAGIHVPLVIDAPTWGQDVDMLQSAGPSLIAADPDKNLLFSVHLWWNDPKGTRIKAELNESAGMNLPLIVGEFAQHNFSGCSSQALDYKTLLSSSKTLDIGWLAWSWGGVKNQDCADDQPFDMTGDGTFASLNGWGLDVAVTDPNGIQQTSQRPRYMTSGSCD